MLFCNLCNVRAGMYCRPRVPHRPCPRSASTGLRVEIDHQFYCDRIKALLCASIAGVNPTQNRHSRDWGGASFQWHGC